MSEDKKVNVEQKRLRARNIFEVVNQIVNEFNSSNGWALVKVVPIGITTLDVYLERSSKQAEPKKADVEDKPKAAPKPAPKAPTKAKAASKSTTKTATKEKNDE